MPETPQEQVSRLGYGQAATVEEVDTEPYYSPPDDIVYLDCGHYRILDHEADNASLVGSETFCPSHGYMPMDYPADLPF